MGEVIELDRHREARAKARQLAAEACARALPIALTDWDRALEAYFETGLPPAHWMARG